MHRVGAGHAGLGFASHVTDHMRHLYSICGRVCLCAAHASANLWHYMLIMVVWQSAGTRTLWNAEHTVSLRTVSSFN